jgi:anti-sigma factor RsiW
MSGHDELISLLGAYALDAIDDDERAAVEEHLAICARCRDEVAQHLEVAAALGTTAAMSAPDDLWSTIQHHLDDGPAETPAIPVLPGLVSAPTPSGPVEATASTVAPAPSPGVTVVALDQRRRRPPAGYVAGLAAAVVLIVLLAAGLVQVTNHNAELEREIAAGPPAASIDELAESALADGSNQVIKLASESGTDTATAVVTPTGDAYLMNSTLDPLPADRTYQLWNIGDAGAVSLGVLGNQPGTSAFHVQGPVGTLAITAEQAGGVPSPANVPLVTSTV